MLFQYVLGLPPSLFSAAAVFNNFWAHVLPFGSLRVAEKIWLALSIPVEVGVEEAAEALHALLVS